jgi:hypothetical protein
MQLNLERYKFCEELESRCDRLDEDDVEQLEEYCFTEQWEERLSVANGDPFQMREFLNLMMRECEMRIENLPEFQLFREKLKDKLK